MGTVFPHVIRESSYSQRLVVIVAFHSRGASGAGRDERQFRYWYAGIVRNS
jgi:hypothetical protein